MDWYDYGARFYDPQLGRFHSVDPMADYHPEATLYHYCFNNPMRFIDPMGMDTLSVNPDGLPHVDLDEVVVAPDNNNDDDNPSSETADNTQNNSSEDGNTEQANLYIPAIPWYITTGRVVSTGVVRALGTVSIFLNIPGDTPDYKKTYKPAPTDLPGFPGAVRVKPKGGRARWRLPNGDIAEWDSQHGEVEVYDKTGKNHKGAYDPDSGKRVKPKKKGRSTKK